MASSEGAAAAPSFSHSASPAGKTLGRPRTNPATEKAIREALGKGDAGMHKIAARFGVGTGTVQRIRAEMA
jgi:hypothetical protein